MYVYVSEDLPFSDFNNKEALFWLEEELNYGDWTSGFNNDGSYERSGVITATEVLDTLSLEMLLTTILSGKKTVKRKLLRIFCYF